MTALLVGKRITTRTSLLMLPQVAEFSGIVSRDCTNATLCTSGCLPDIPRACVYCCSSANFCNDQSVAEALARMFHCYSCTYSTDPSAADLGSEACNDPFDSEGAGVTQIPCDGGVCGVSRKFYSIPICFAAKFHKTCIADASKFSE